MEKKQKLFEIADSQQGFFTTQQAVRAGYTQSNFHRMVQSGDWIREGRRIYRLRHYPVTERPELVLWYLWSSNRIGKPQGVWSHETALDIYELSDIMPSKMHMTVPKGFKRTSVPEILNLHYENLGSAEVIHKNGYVLTTPIRTIVDIIRENVIERQFVMQSIVEATEKGLLTKSTILKHRQMYPEVEFILDTLNEKI